MGNDYSAFRLKKETVETLQMLKQAYEICYDKPFTNDEFVNQLTASVEDGDVTVWETYCELSQKLDELKQRAKKRMAQ